MNYSFELVNVHPDRLSGLIDRLKETGARVESDPANPGIAWKVKVLGISASVAYKLETQTLTVEILQDPRRPAIVPVGYIKQKLAAMLEAESAQ